MVLMPSSGRLAPPSKYCSSTLQGMAVAQRDSAFSPRTVMNNVDQGLLIVQTRVVSREPANLKMLGYARADVPDRLIGPLASSPSRAFSWSDPAQLFHTITHPHRTPRGISRHLPLMRAARLTHVSPTSSSTHRRSVKLNVPISVCDLELAITSVDSSADVAGSPL